MTYFVIREGENEGPYTVDALRELAEKGELTTDSLLLTESGDGRLRAGLVVGIFGPPSGEVLAEVAAVEPPSEDYVRARRRLFTILGVFFVIAIAISLSSAYMIGQAAKRRQLIEARKQQQSMREITVAMLAYVSANGDAFPPVSGGSWQSLIKKYGPTVPTIPFEQSSAMLNPKLLGKKLSDFPDPKRKILFFDINATDDAQPRWRASTIDGAVGYTSEMLRGAASKDTLTKPLEPFPTK